MDYQVNNNNQNDKENQIWKTFKIIVGSIFKAIYKTFLAVKFIFTIPLLSFAASVFVLLIMIIFKPLINFLPDSLNTGFIESLIGGIIFIALRYFIYKDKLIYNKDFDHEKNLSGFIFSIIFWILPILLFKNEAFFALDFLEQGRAYTPFSLIYVIFYLPHMWLGVLFTELYYVVMAGILINCVIAAVLTGIYTRNFIGIDDNN